MQTKLCDVLKSKSLTYPKFATMTQMISIPVDSSILLSLKTSKEEFARELLFNHALILYRKERLSLGKAAQLAGYSRMAFIEELMRRGEPIFDYDDEHTLELSNQAAFLHNLVDARDTQ